MMKRPSSPSRGDLDPVEWDFRDEKVPTTETELCFIYEYARELAERSERLQKLLSSWRSYRGAPPTSRQHRKASRAYSEAMYLLGECFDTSVIVDDEFPRTPWQRLNENQKSAIAAGVEKGRLNAFEAPLAITLLGDTRNVAMRFSLFRSFQNAFHDDVARLKYGFVAIDLRKSASVIKRAFAEWLLSQKPSDRPRNDATGSNVKQRARFRHYLNRLAALRLWAHYRPKGLLKDACDPRSGIRFKTAPYHHLSDLYEAKAKAEKFLTFFLGIIDGN